VQIHLCSKSAINFCSVRQIFMLCYVTRVLYINEFASCNILQCNGCRIFTVHQWYLLSRHVILHPVLNMNVLFSNSAPSSTTSDVSRTRPLKFTNISHRTAKWKLMHCKKYDLWSSDKWSRSDAHTQSHTGLSLYSVSYWLFQNTWKQSAIP
jgi:hypothetical protein